jgi:hypothetical protein
MTGLCCRAACDEMSGVRRVGLKGKKQALRECCVVGSTREGN